MTWLHYQQHKQEKAQLTEEVFAEVAMEKEEQSKGTCFCTEGRAFVHHNPNKTTQRDQCLVFLWGPLAINLQVPRPFLY